MKAYKNRNLFGSATALLSCLLLFSCDSEDIFDRSDVGFVGKHSDSICFGVSPDGSAQTRSQVTDGRNEYTAEQFVLRSQDSADTLCVRAIVSEGIHSSGGKQAVTRATPVAEGNFYDAFHVLAYWKKNGQLVQEKFYMDEDVSEKGNNLWSATNTYYWPGDGHSLQFYAWAPVNAFTATPKIPTETTLKYTVPLDVAFQNDLLVTTTGELNGNGNSNTVVPLTFRHICTAVRFETGSQMQAGTISSVTLKGIKKTGTYDMATYTWELTEDTDDFTQELSRTTTGAETAGSEVTSAAQTFMMLPQTLPDGATVEVVFVDGTTSTERTLSASIAGMEWPQGTTVTYRISITPEYELEFISEPEIQDAHYIIYPIHIKAGDNIPGGSWTLTSTDSKNVTLRTGLTILTRRGFWVEDDKGTDSITSTAVGDDITVYAFLTENAGEATREINLELKPTNSADAIPQTFTISQLCPSWNGDIGCERIEEYDEGYTGYPWGFLWDADMKITYDILNSDLGFFEQLLLTIYMGFFDNSEFVQQDINVFPLRNNLIIDFSKISPLDVAMSEINGQKNTFEIYNFDGINDASSLMQALEKMGVHADKTLPTNPTVFAARACALKNKFNKETIEQQGETIERPVLRDENLVWYLPARNEALHMKDNDYPLSGNYWTSTAINDNENAYKYNTVGGSTSSELRTSNLHVRAVRKKP